MPYNDMADKCEVLLMEKHRMSRLMSAQQKQDSLEDSLLMNQNNVLKNMESSNQMDFQKVIPGVKISCLHSITTYACFCFYLTKVY